MSLVHVKDNHTNQITKNNYDKNSKFIFKIIIKTNQIKRIRQILRKKLDYTS